MLTLTCPQDEINEATVIAAVDNTLSDAEIASRVLRIRSNWTLAERIQRRHEADRRFEDLLAALSEAA